MILIVVLRILSRLQGKSTGTLQQQALLWKLCFLFIVK